MRPSILKSFCSKSQICMRAFCIHQNQQIQGKIPSAGSWYATKPPNLISREPNIGKECTYALKKPKYQILQPSRRAQINQRGTSKGQYIVAKHAGGKKKRTIIRRGQRRSRVRVETRELTIGWVIILWTLVVAMAVAATESTLSDLVWASLLLADAVV